MAQLFTRDGKPAPAGAPVLGAGKPYFMQTRPCTRCGGLGGSEAWRHTGWTCYQCGGNGKGDDVAVRLYTAEQNAKLDAAQAKRNAKKQAEADAAAAVHRAEADLRRAGFQAEYADVLPWLRAEVAKLEARQEVGSGRAEGFLPDMLRRADTDALWTPAQGAAVRSSKAKTEAAERVRAASRHVGDKGARLDLRVTVERVRDFTRQHPVAYWQSQTVYVVTMRDAEGNCLVSKSSSFTAAEGASLRIRGTVSAHDEFRGEKQTQLIRVQDVEKAAAEHAQAKADAAKPAACWDPPGA